MDELRQIKGRIFSVQGYSIHDGPGVRTTVFLSGCPLRCKWCQNPESQKLEPTLFFFAEKCTGCAACVSACPEHAISIQNGLSKTNRTLCRACGRCAAACPSGARELVGEEKSAGELLERICRDRIFFTSSGGGVTLSGGEVLSQPQFSAALLELCKAEGLHTAIETCGFGPWESFERILEHTDLVLYDFKHMDSARHELGTGVGNELILENAERVYNTAKKKMAARVPVIPGFNDTQENMTALASFITNRLGADVKVHLLPYHNLGESKKERMEQEEGKFTADIPTDKALNILMKPFESAGIEAVVGG